MKKILYIITFLFVVLNLSSQEITRIEPPHWYADMNNKELQLLMYGENIQDYKLVIEGQKAKLVCVHHVKNPNYIFVDILLGDFIKPGKLNIDFYKKGKKVSTYPYRIKKRKVDPSTMDVCDASDVVYLITPDRFANGDKDNDVVKQMRENELDRANESGRHGGDIQGVLDHLAFVEEMGYTSLWLNPVLENNQPQWSYHGYATTDYYKVDPRFGTNELYRELADKAREKGIGLVMDLIVNHCGSEHWWMKDLPMHNWVNYQWDEYTNTNHRKSTLLDPYAAPSDRKKMTNGWFVPQMPDLNQKNPHVAKYLIQNSIWWIEYLGLHGIRQDTYSYPDADFMSDWTCAILDEYPDFYIVGEEWVNDPAIISYWQQGKDNGYKSCLKGLMDFPMNMKLVEAFTEKEEWGKGLVKIYENLANDHHYPNPNEFMIFADNHDMSRVFEQVDGDLTAYKMIMGYLMTIRGIPQVYYGTEILMDHPISNSHGQIRTDFPGGWKGDKVNGFTGKGLSSQQEEARSWLKKLLNWRKEAGVIHSGKTIHYEPQDGIYVYFRYNDKNEIVMVIFNKNESPTKLSLSRFRKMLKGISYGTDTFSGEHTMFGEMVMLPGKGVTIWELH